MSLFYDDFDRLQQTVNALMGDFGSRRGGLGGIGGGQRRGRRGLMDPLGMLDDEWLGGDWGMGTSPLLLQSGQPLTGGQDTTLAGGKGPEETKMDESAGTSGSTALTTQPEQRVGGLQLPTLRCRVNVEDVKDKLIVTAEVPGFDKQNLKVHIDDNNVLTIAGEQKQEHVEEAKNKKFLRVERSFGQVQRSLRLPRNIDKSKVSASYQNGILHIDVPKVEQEKTQTPVNIE